MEVRGAAACVILGGGGSFSNKANTETTIPDSAWFPPCGHRGTS